MSFGWFLCSHDKMKDSKDSSIWLKAEWKRGEVGFFKCRFLEFSLVISILEDE